MDIMNSNLLVCEDPRAASIEAAERFACSAVRSVAKYGVFHVAIPGGSSPREMFLLLAGGEFRDLVPWSRMELFFTDERCVPPEDDESNYKLAFDLLISTVPIPEPSIHRMLGEDEPESSAAQYEEEIHRVMGHSPRFELIILGMGADAHTASLFPGSPALRETGRHVVSNYVEKLGAHRLTLTLPLINRAEQVIILAFGQEKAQALAHALKEPEDVNQYPVQGVRPTSGRLLWIVDRAAALPL